MYMCTDKLPVKSLSFKVATLPTYVQVQSKTSVEILLLVAWSSDSMKKILNRLCVAVTFFIYWSPPPIPPQPEPTPPWLSFRTSLKQIKERSSIKGQRGHWDLLTKTTTTVRHYLMSEFTFGRTHFLDLSSPTELGHVIRNGKRRPAQANPKTRISGDYLVFNISITNSTKSPCSGNIPLLIFGRSLTTTHLRTKKEKGDSFEPLINQRESPLVFHLFSALNPKTKSNLIHKPWPKILMMKDRIWFHYIIKVTL